MQKNESYRGEDTYLLSLERFRLIRRKEFLLKSAAQTEYVVGTVGIRNPGCHQCLRELESGGKTSTSRALAQKPGCSISSSLDCGLQSRQSRASGTDGAEGSPGDSQSLRGLSSLQKSASAEEGRVTERSKAATSTSREFFF